MKHTISGIENIENVHKYVIKKGKDINKSFCNLLSDLNFEEDSIAKADVVFDDLDNELIYLTDGKSDVYLFVTKTLVNFVIKTGISQKELNKTMAKYFNLPKQI